MTDPQFNIRRSKPEYRINSLEGKLVLVSVVLLVVAVFLGSVLQLYLGVWWLSASLILLLALPVLIYLLHRVIVPVNQLLQALSDMVTSIKDNDFSVSLSTNRKDELGDLVRAHSELGHILRSERQNLYQRELLLDTVIQSTSQALLLTNANSHVVYSNAAARILFAGGRPLNGFSFNTLLESCDPAFGEAVANEQDGLFTIGGDEPQTYHLSFTRFTLNNQPHNLYLFKLLTQELSRREVETWKNVIRVISHELNNSLAPISSLAHSGTVVSQKFEDDRLNRIFRTIEDRSTHLKEFIESYAQIARLPTPVLENVEWRGFLDQLVGTVPFRFQGEIPEHAGRFDARQIEQVLINLIKNAHEAGSAPQDTELAVVLAEGMLFMRVSDRGSGMTEQVAANALLPFYSTKHSGSGLGLPLCREIIEAHGGRLKLRNREGGGLVVEIILKQI